jgi:hypothetical protein
LECFSFSLISCSAVGPVVHDEEDRRRKWTRRRRERDAFTLVAHEML